MPDNDIDLFVLLALLLFKDGVSSAGAIAAFSLLGGKGGGAPPPAKAPTPKPPKKNNPHGPGFYTLGDLLTAKIGPKLVAGLPRQVPLFLRF